jgi:hypothetical protein
MAVFIIGMHRSGTSMVASVLDALGVHFGADSELLPANQANVAGYFENKHILAMNDRLAAANNLNWRTLPAISTRKKIDGIEQYLSDAEAAVSAMSTQSIWGIKDPRLSFFLPYWKPVAPDSSVIICVRKPDAVALSLNIRNDLSMAYGGALWELYTLAALKNSRRMPRVALVYEKLLEDPAAAVKKIIAAVPELTEIDFPDDVLASAAARIKSDLDHSDDHELEADFLTEKQLKLYERLASGTLAVSRKDEAAPLSSELTRLEAAHQTAKAAVSAANSEIRNLRTALDSSKLQGDAFLARVRDLAQTFVSDHTIGSNPEDVVSSLQKILRRTGELPSGWLPTSAVDQLNSMRDQQIVWFQSELETAAIRARNVLDQLQDALLESVGLRIKIEEAERQRQTAAESEKMLRDEHEALRRELAMNEILLKEARDLEAETASELRNLNRNQSDMRTAMLHAQLQASELATQLSEKTRALDSIVHRNEALSASHEDLKRTHVSVLADLDRWKTERDAFANERVQLMKDVTAEKARFERQSAALSEEVGRLKVDLAHANAERSDLVKRIETFGQELADTRKQRDEAQQQATGQSSSRSADSELKVTRIALENANELVASLEAEISELKTLAGSQTYPAQTPNGEASGPAENSGSVETAVVEFKAAVERLTKERDALQKSLAAARQSQSSAEERLSSPDKSDKKPVFSAPGTALHERLAKQLAVMQHLVSDIDVLLAPKFGGRFWIPVRKVRVKLVQLRQVLDAELARARRRD